MAVPQNAPLFCTGLGELASCCVFAHSLQRNQCLRRNGHNRSLHERIQNRRICVYKNTHTLLTNVRVVWYNILNRIKPLKRRKRCEMNPQRVREAEIRAGTGASNGPLRARGKGNEYGATGERRYGSGVCRHSAECTGQTVKQGGSAEVISSLTSNCQGFFIFRHT